MNPEKFKMRGVLILSFALNILFSNTNVSQVKGELPLRKDIQENLTWNLNDIYKSIDEWEKDYKWCENSISKYNEFRGTLNESAEDLLKCLLFDDEIGIKVNRLYLFASLSRDLDLGNAENQGRYDRISTLASDIAAASSFIRPELLNIPEERLWKFY